VEKILEVTEEIEKKGTEILKVAQDKAKKILELAENNIEKLRIAEIEKANNDAIKIYEEFQTELSNKIRNLLKEKDKKVESILNLDITQININNLIMEDILDF